MRFWSRSTSWPCELILRCARGRRGEGYRMVAGGLCGWGCGVEECEMPGRRGRWGKGWREGERGGKG